MLYKPNNLRSIPRSSKVDGERKLVEKSSKKWYGMAIRYSVGGAKRGIGVRK